MEHRNGLLVCTLKYGDSSTISSTRFEGFCKNCTRCTQFSCEIIILWKEDNSRITICSPKIDVEKAIANFLVEIPIHFN